MKMNFAIAALGLLLLAGASYSFCIPVINLCIAEQGKDLVYFGNPTPASPPVRSPLPAVAASKEYICNPDSRVNREYRPGIDTCIPNCNNADYRCDNSTCTCKPIYTCYDSDPQNQCKPGTCPQGKTCKSVLPVAGDVVCDCVDEEPINRTANCSSGSWQPGFICENDCGRLNTPNVTFVCNKNCQCEPRLAPISVAGKNCSMSNISGLCGGWCPSGYSCNFTGVSISPCGCVPNKQLPSANCSWNNLTRSCGGTCPVNKECKLFGGVLGSATLCTCQNKTIEPPKTGLCNWSDITNSCGGTCPTNYSCTLNPFNNSPGKPCGCFNITAPPRTDNYTCAFSNITQSCGGTCPAGKTCNYTGSWVLPCSCVNATQPPRTDNYTCAFSNITQSCGGTCPTGKTCNYTGSWVLPCSCVNATQPPRTDNYTCAFSNITNSCGGTCPSDSFCNYTSASIGPNGELSSNPQCWCQPYTKYLSCNMTQSLPLRQGIDLCSSNNCGAYGLACNRTTCLCYNDTIAPPQNACAYSNITKSCGGTCPDKQVCVTERNIFDNSVLCKCASSGTTTINITINNTVSCSSNRGNASGQMCIDDCSGWKNGSYYQCLGNCTCRQRTKPFTNNTNDTGHTINVTWETPNCSSGLALRGPNGTLLCKDDCASKYGAGYVCLQNCTCAINQTNYTLPVAIEIQPLSMPAGKSGTLTFTITNNGHTILEAGPATATLRNSPRSFYIQSLAPGQSTTQSATVSCLDNSKTELAVSYAGYRQVSYVYCGTSASGRASGTGALTANSLYDESLLARIMATLGR